MTRILLVRHGHVEGIDPPRFRGRMELELTELGRRQAVLTGERIAERWRPTAIYSSPMQRCLQTGAPLARAIEVSVQPVPTLHDLDYGEWQWKTFDAARSDDPEMFRLWFAAPQLVRFPNGESLQDLLLRTSNAVRAKLARHPEETIAMIGHDSVNRALLLQLLDLPLSGYWRIPQSPCGISEVLIVGGAVEVLRLNETGHLDKG